jgi:RNA polymerase sigma factor (sigma-70 family)
MTDAPGPSGPSGSSDSSGISSSFDSGGASAASAVAEKSAADAYAELYEREHPRLVGYARSLTANSWLAEDLVAEAHFRVWRRIQGGHRIDNVPAYLRTTIRHLATTVGAAASREIPQDPEGEQAWPDAAVTESSDPLQRVAYVDLLARVLGQLPQRWVKALWLAEAEDQPLEAVGKAIGAGKGATAVLLHRAREGMRQAFLRAVPGHPDRPECAAHWDRMPALVRGEATARQADGLADHVADCPDCRARMALLTQANHRLPALTGPALLVLLAGGSAKFLLPLVGAGAAASAGGAQAPGAGGAQAPGAGGAQAPGAGGAMRSVRHLLRGQFGQAGPVAATVAGIGLAAVAGVAVAAGLALTSDDAVMPEQRAAPAPSRPGGGETGQARSAGPSAPPASPARPPSTSVPPSPPAGDPARTSAASIPPSSDPSTAPNPEPPATQAPPVPPEPTVLPTGQSPTHHPEPTAEPADPTPAPPTDPPTGPTTDPTAEPTTDPTVAPPECGWEHRWGWWPVWTCRTP